MPGLSERFGIRKASIHQSFPRQVWILVVAVIEQARRAIQAQDRLR